MRVVRALLRAVLGRRAPNWDGDIAVDGLDAPVTVRRDRFGVAYVDAATDADAWFGLGFCHGQDRAGQLEITLRLIRGTLAEVAGADALSIDRLSRRLGLARAGRAQLEAADPDVRAQLDAYARGVNAGMRQGGRRRAHELALLGCPPTPWEAADAQGFSVMMCFALAANWDIELVRLRILTRHGPDALAALDPATPEWLTATLPPGSAAPSAVDALAADARAFSDLVGLGGGSNAWVVAGSRTASGRPILANDPHLPPQAPAMWYLTRLRTPEWTCAGASFVGAPAMGAAHNGVAAWGVTALHADVTDLFLEELGPDGASVREGDAFVACPVRTETIAVKGRKDPVVERILDTPRGPIVGPAFDGAPAALSMSASWLAPRAYRGLLGIHRARTVEDFRRINAQSATANTAICFALADGTIGFQAAADVPVRRLGRGTVPLPGWDPRTGWDGVVDPADMPFATDPEAGYFVTANNAPRAAGAPDDGPFLGVDWLDGYRATTIARALARRDNWDLAGTARLQLDTTSPVWPEIRDGVLATPIVDADGPADRARRMLEAWNGDLAPDQAGASLYVYFTAALIRRIVAEKAPDEAPAALGRGATELLPYNLLFTRRLSHMVRLLRARPADFFAEATWDAVVADALGDAYTTLRRRGGRDEARWAWGRVRRLVMRHPFGDKRALDRVFNVHGLVCGGDASTVAQAAVDFEDPSRDPIGIATLRAVIDVGAWDDSRWALLGGQSGNPMMPGYRDQTPLWSRGEGLPIWWSDARRDEATAHTMTLRPDAAELAG